MIPHDLDLDHKIERVEKSKALLKILKEHQKTDFKYFITLDESWFYLHNETEYMYTDSPEKVPPMISHDISSEKLNITIAFCGNRLFLLRGFSRGISTNQVLFKEEILKRIVKKIHNRREGPSIVGYHIHFHNAVPYTASKTAQYLMKTKLKKANNPSFSQDLSPCDFWFFGYCKNKLKGMKIKNNETLLQKVLHDFGEVTFEELQSVITDWMDRPNTVFEINCEGINESLY